MPTIQEIGAKINRQAVNGLARNIRAMPAEKQLWKPLDNGRDAIDQVKEVAAINFITVDILRDRALPEDFGGAYQKYLAEVTSPEEAIDLLTRSGDALAAAILAFPDAELEKTITMPWDSEPSTFAELFVMPYWNIAYHIGQVCYIQTLYGDREMH